MIKNNFKILFCVNSEGTIRCNINHLKFNISTENEYWIMNEIFGDKLYNFQILYFDRVICIDIGMNIGLASLYFTLNDNIEKIYVFEPFQETYKIALKNFNLNDEKIRSKIIPY